jgi:acetyl-CoA decarbonylase/synthase, CODH/ACS complex subunit delta
MEIYKESGAPTHQVKIGALPEEGGTRAVQVVLGGETDMPFLNPAAGPPKPALALEIWDAIPEEPPRALQGIFQDIWHDPVLWAEQCQEKFQPDLLCLRLLGAHPDGANTSAADAANLVKSLLQAVKLPLIIMGCGVPDKDNEVLAAASQAGAGERCLLGCASQENYKTLTASALADGHNIIASSPIDMNIAKQLNILIAEMGLPLDRIVIDPNTGGLGYGLEYTYSIMERIRLTALTGDKYLGSPMVNFVGEEAWNAKEAKDEDLPWGDTAIRGIFWEAATAMTFINSGAQLLIMLHPESLLKVRQTLFATR